MLRQTLMFCLTLVLVSCLAVGCGTAPPAETATQAAPSVQKAKSLPLPSDPAVAVGTLPNGLTYYVRENQRPEQRASLFLVVAAGAVDEDDDQLGLAHMAEHMAFNGTEHYPKQALIDYLESIGMAFGPEINAFTSFDQTVYMLQVPTDDETLLDTGLKILENWAHRVQFEDEEIDLERGVIIEEWRGGLGADDRIWNRQLPVLFHGSKYGRRNVIGDMEIVANHEYDTIRRFYRDWYRPSLQAVVAVGDFDRERMVAKIGEVFAELRDPDPPRVHEQPPVPDHAELLVSVVTDPEATRTGVELLWKSAPERVTTAGELRWQMVRDLGLDMLRNRLQERTRDADPPFSMARAGYRQFTRTANSFSLTAFAPEGGAVRALEVLAVEAERVRRHGFTAGELERAKVRTLRQMQRRVEEQDKTESRAWAFQYMRHFLYGGNLAPVDDLLRRHEELLPGITEVEVEAAILGLMTDRNRVVAISGPDRDGLAYPAEVDVAAVIAATMAGDVAPYEDQTVDAPLVAMPPRPAAVTHTETDAELGTTTWVLANGVRIVVKPTAFKNDEILMRAYRWGGASVVADSEQRRLAGTAARGVAESGVGAFDPVALQKALAGKVVSCSPNVASLASGFEGSASPRDLETLLQLVWLYATSFREDAAAFTSWQQRMRTWLQGRDADPMTALRDSVQVLLYDRAPEQRPFTVADLDRVNLADGLAFYRLQAADFAGATFFFVGNVTPGDLEPLARTYLGNLPASGREPRWYDRSTPTAVGLRTATIHKGLDPKGYVQVVLSGHAPWSRPAEYALESLIDCLRIRLRQVVREEMSGTYGVRTWGRLEKIPRETFRIDIGWGCDPERVEELSAAVREVLADMAAHGPDAETLAKVRETQLREDQTRLQTNRHWLQQLVTCDQEGLDPRRILARADEVATLSTDLVRDAAGRYLTAGNEVRVVLLPEGQADR